MRIAYDTNLFVYADAGDRAPQDGDKWEVVDRLTGRHLAAGDNLFVPAQALIELHDVLFRKRRLPRGEAGARVDEWRDTFDVLATDETVLDAALLLSSNHDLRIFDAVILAAAAEARCNVLYSEDFHEGFVWRGCRVVNPFA